VQTERDRQPDLDHVSEDAFSESPKLIRTSHVQGAERQDDQIHEEEHRDSIEEAAYQPMVRKNLQFASHDTIDRRGREGDKEVQ
jgi:hypothetical protein